MNTIKKLQASSIENSAVNNSRILSFDIQKYPFSDIIKDVVFRTPCLYKLHTKLHDADKKIFSDKLLSRKHISNMVNNSRFYVIYHAFVREVLSPLFGGKISYSAHPAFRVHLPGSPSISGWHTDVQVTGRHDQINVWLPFVDTNGTNTIYVETDYGRKDYIPIPVRYGEALLFDGGYLLHGSVTNATDNTRVSMDFRFSVLKVNYNNSLYCSILSSRNSIPEEYKKVLSQEVEY